MVAYEGTIQIFFSLSHIYAVTSIATIYGLFAPVQYTHRMWEVGREFRGHSVPCFGWILGHGSGLVCITYYTLGPGIFIGKHRLIAPAPTTLVD